MSHGSIELDAPVDHTASALLSDLTTAETLASHARKNAVDAEINLSLARLAVDRAQLNAAEARRAYREHVARSRA